MGYVTHILTIKLWEWEAVKEKASTEILKEQNIISNRQIVVANERIEVIRAAIMKLGQDF